LNEYSLKYDKNFAFNNTVLLSEPKNFKDIFNKSDKELWLEALNNEFNSLEKLKVFTKVNKVKEGTNIITPKIIFKYKLKPDGNIDKRKARVVYPLLLCITRGYTQKEGVDYDKTFSLTLRQKSLRLLTALGVQNNFKIHQLDVKTAYLNAKLKEEIYMYPPEGHKDHNKYIWKLNKALYGFK